MRIPLIPLICLWILCICADVRIFRDIKLRVADKRRCGILKGVHIISAIILYGILIVGLCLPRRSGDDKALLEIMWLLFTFLTFYIPKILYCLFDLAASLPRLWGSSRIKWISKTGAWLGIVIFIFMWWGALIGRFSVQIKEITVEIPGLPEAFEGYRIIQISDFHVGTYGQDTVFVSKTVDRLNRLDADLIVFTGDIVNRHSEELLPFVEPFGRLKADDGVMAILGNHDYGDYHDWPSATAKEENRELLIDLFEKMGWRLLLNETEFVRKDNDSLAIVGVENIGDAPFPVYGSLSESYPHLLSDSVTKILLTHNPAHWTDEIESNPEINIPLTLSGHTHAMQIEIFGWSPAVFRYPKWGGLYSSASDPDKHLYVNIGMGEVAIPMRLGARPEITVITLTGVPEK